MNKAIDSKSVTASFGQVRGKSKSRTAVPGNSSLSHKESSDLTPRSYEKTSHRYPGVKRSATGSDKKLTDLKDLLAGSLNSSRANDTSTGSVAKPLTIPLSQVEDTEVGPPHQAAQNLIKSPSELGITTTLRKSITPSRKANATPKTVSVRDKDRRAVRAFDSPISPSRFTSFLGSSELLNNTTEEVGRLKLRPVQSDCNAPHGLRIAHSNTMYDYSGDQESTLVTPRRGQSSKAKARIIRDSQNVISKYCKVSSRKSSQLIDEINQEQANPEASPGKSTGSHNPLYAKASLTELTSEFKREHHDSMKSTRSELGQVMATHSNRVGALKYNSLAGTPENRSLMSTFREGASQTNQFGNEQDQKNDPPMSRQRRPGSANTHRSELYQDMLSKTHVNAKNPFSKQERGADLSPYSVASRTSHTDADEKNRTNLSMQSRNKLPTTSQVESLSLYWPEGIDEYIKNL